MVRSPATTTPPSATMTMAAVTTTTEARDAGPGMFFSLFFSFFHPSNDCADYSYGTRMANGSHDDGDPSISYFSVIIINFQRQR